MNSKKLTALIASLLLLGLLVVGGVPAQAHGSGIVKSCDPGTNCTSATFATCDPAVPPYACSSLLNPTKGPRSVTIQLSSFPANTAVHVFFLKTEVDDPNKTDCTQALGTGRTELTGSPVTTNGTGKASLNATLPPGNFPTNWNYGVNWICATSASAAGGTGTIGDQAFNIFTGA